MEKKLAVILRNNLARLPRENVDSGRTKSADKKRSEGVISKEMLLSRSTSVLSYSATYSSEVRLIKIIYNCKFFKVVSFLHL